MPRKKKAEQWSPDVIPEITDVELAFPAGAMRWMPPEDEIPEKFKDHHDPWHRIALGWMFNGLPENVEFYPKKGVDAAKAFRVLQATLGSYMPRHEHKMAAVAYMMSCWFTEIKNWEVENPPRRLS